VCERMIRSCEPTGDADPATSRRARMARVGNAGAGGAAARAAAHHTDASLESFIAHTGYANVRSNAGYGNKNGRQGSAWYCISLWL